MKTGIYNIPASVYHADPCEVPSLSCSLIKILLAQSPAHAWIEHPRLNPNYADSGSSSPMDIGSASHALFLEGQDSVVVCDFDDWRKKDAQTMRDEARSAGKIPLLAKQYGDVLEMSLIATEAAKKCGFNLAAGKPEQTVIWQEGETFFRIRPDWLNDDRDLIIDYKTTALPNPAAWKRAICSNGYDIQDALYSLGIEAVTGNKPQFVFMVQENFAPYACYFVELSETMKEIGRIKVEKAILLWSACMKLKNWPAYPAGIQEAEAMPWQLAEAEEMAAEISGSLDAATRFDLDARGVKEAFLFGKVPPK